MLKNVEKNIIDWVGGKTVAVSVSGGSDSMCLLSLFLNCRQHLKGLQVVTFDHQLRTQSAFETNFVLQFCKQHNLECTVCKSDLQFAKGNVEQAARLWRKDIFFEVLKRVDVVALGHHLDDQIETILYRIFRGTGLNGLSAMPMFSVDNLFRPLIETPKHEILSYVSLNSLSFVQDLSNFDSAYDRNYIRNCIIPLIKARWNISNISNLAKIAADLQSFLHTCIDESALVCQKDSVLLPIRLLDDPLKFEYVACALKKFGINVTHSLYARVETLKSLQSGKRVALTNEIVAQREYDCIRLFKKSKKLTRNLHIGFSGLGTFELEYASFELQLVDTQDYRSQLVFDLDKVPANAVWRHRKAGDTFKAFKSCSKALKKYLIDKKVAQLQRDKLVLLCVENQVLLIVGVEIGDILKCDETTVNKATATSIAL